MKSKKTTIVVSVFFALLLGFFSLTSVQAQPTSGPGIDPNALLILDMEEGDISGWTTNTINRGEKVSVELMDAENGDPVRFGRYAVKLNWDLTAAQTNQTLACLYSPPGNAFVIPAAPNPRKMGMWIYASPECYNNIWFRVQLFNPPGAAGSGTSSVAAWGNEPSYANINWTGWKYHEFTFPDKAANKELGPPASTTPSYGMFRLLQEKSGTNGRQLTKGYFIIDNVRITSASEDTTRPTISALKGNGQNLANATFTTSAVDFTMTYSDNLSGINAESAVFVINGEMYKFDSSGFTANETTATLTGKTFRNGTHTVVAHIEDKFGNIQELESKFTVNDPNQDATTITLVPDATAHIGNTFQMKVNTNKSKDIKNLDLVIELNQFASIAATGAIDFGPTVTDGTYSYNASNKHLTIHLDNDHTADHNGTLATINVGISKNSNPDDVLRVTPVTSTAKYADDETAPFTFFTAFNRPVTATYNVDVLSRIEGVPAVVKVTDMSNNPVEGATVYGDAATGTTDAEGLATVNFTSIAKAVNVYATKDGKYSFTHIVRVLIPQVSNIPSAIRSGTTVDPSREKTFTWLTNPKTSKEPAYIKIAKKSDGESSFTQIQGESRILEFDAVSSSGVARGSKVTVTDLEPGTEYIYKLGDGTNWTPTRQFKTTTRSNKFTFSAYGDYQATGKSDATMWLSAAQFIQNLDEVPFFSLNVGDIVDNDNNWAYHDHYSYIFDQRPEYANIDMISAYGNHEYMGTPNADIIKFLNGHPSIAPSTKYNIDAVGDGSYYTVYGNMVVLSLDWEVKGQGFSASQRQTEQVKWIDEVLTAHRDKTWKIITLHYEIPNASFTPSSMATLGPVLDKHDVNIAFCGHGHTFRRVQVKNNTWTPSSYTRTAAPVAGAGTLHWQMGGMRPSDGNNQRWVFAEVDDTSITFTTRNASGDIVANECFTLTTTPPTIHQVEYSVVNAANGTLSAKVDGAAINSGDLVDGGKTVVFTATPKEGYKVQEWRVNGKVVEGEEDVNFAISNLTAYTDVTVKFDMKVGVENVNNVRVLVYPNPFNDVVYVQGAANSTVKITDIAGKLVHSQAMTSTETVYSTKHLAAGVYFINVAHEGSVQTVKMVKK